MNRLRFLWLEVGTECVPGWIIQGSHWWRAFLQQGTVYPTFNPLEGHRHWISWYSQHGRHIAFQRELGQLSSVRRVKPKNESTLPGYIQPLLKRNQSRSIETAQLLAELWWTGQMCTGVLKELPCYMRVSHTLQHTHHLLWLHGKKAEACNQSWLRWYRAATGSLCSLWIETHGDVWCYAAPPRW